MDFFFSFLLEKEEVRLLNLLDFEGFDLQKAETASTEKNRASAVALNAEIRRIKARLLEEVPKLQRLAIKKV